MSGKYQTWRLYCENNESWEPKSLLNMVMYSHILLTYRGNVYHGEVSPRQQPIKPTVSDILHQKLQHIDEYFINLKVLVKSK